jgi:hypothetical protein
MVNRQRTSSDAFLIISAGNATALSLDVSL